MDELNRLFTNVYGTYDILKNQILRVGVPQEVYNIANRFEAHLQELKDFAESLVTSVTGEAEQVVNEAASAVEEATEAPATEASETTKEPSTTSSIDTTSEPSQNGSQEETQNS